MNNKEKKELLDLINNDTHLSQELRSIAEEVLYNNSSSLYRDEPQNYSEELFNYEQDFDRSTSVPNRAVNSFNLASSQDNNTILNLDETYSENTSSLTNFSSDLPDNVRIIHDPELEKEIISEKEAWDQDLLDLKSYMHKNIPVTLKMTSTSSLKPEGSGISDLYIMGCFGSSQIPVKVPALDFIPNIPQIAQPLFPGSSTILSPRQFCIRYFNSHLGGKFQVLIKSFSVNDESELIVLGSRKEAMRKTQLNTFFNSDYNQRYLQGSIVPARITAVYARVLYVEAGGIEAVINPTEISYSTVPDLRTIYQIGQVIYVYIQDLTVDESAKQILNIKISKRLATKDTRDKLLKKYKKGMEVYGKVIRNIPQGSIVDLGDGITLLATFRKLDRRPPINAKVIVRIDYIDHSSKRLYGFIRSKSIVENLELY